ncbi:hypothetical protein [Mycobacterium sp. E2699]|uniref:hypothetical protein n=1 Tax=Mycobacterium sp. E2699 TaxID=1834137 RepID=UPI0012E9DD8D|nr:hypothetical protein [Mycobacterium sp. E2699]
MPWRASNWTKVIRRNCISGFTRRSCGQFGYLLEPKLRRGTMGVSLVGDSRIKRRLPGFAHCAQIAPGLASKVDEERDGTEGENPGEPESGERLL